VKQLPSFKTGGARVETGFVSPDPELNIPFAVIEGEASGPCLLVTAGVHGAEFCSIEAALRLLRVDPRELRGTIVVLPILNVQGFNRRSIGVMPEDGKNLNRVFPGSADGSLSERLAAWLVKDVFPKVDAYVDLHGGDLTEEIVPIVLFPANDPRSQELAIAFGLPMIVEVPGRGSTIAGGAACGVPSVIVEIGGNGLWTEDQVTQFTHGIDRILAHLGIKRSEATEGRQTAKQVALQTLSASAAGIWYPAKRLSDPVQAGAVLGEVRDAFGAVVATITSEVDGLVLFRLTTLSVNKGETVFGIGRFVG